MTINTVRRFESVVGDDAEEQPLVRRCVRAILIDDQDRLVLIKRTKPGQSSYWTTPGGGVEDDDASLEAALRRELREELGAEIEGPREVFQHTSPVDGGASVQHFFIATLSSLNASASGPEYLDPTRGSYEIDRVDPRGEALVSTDLKPEELKTFLLTHLTELHHQASDQHLPVRERHR